MFQKTPYKLVFTFTFLFLLSNTLGYNLTSQVDDERKEAVQIIDKLLPSDGSLDSHSRGRKLIEIPVSSGVKIHGITNLVAWGLMADLGIIIQRLNRGKKLQLGRLTIPMPFIHGFIMISTVIISLAGTFYIGGQDTSQYDDVQEGPQNAHNSNNTFIMILMALAVASGIISLIVLLQYNKARMSKITFRKLHQLLGWLLYLDARANLITGVMILDSNKWKIPVFIYIGALLGVHLLIQLYISLSYQYSNKSVKAQKVFPVYQESALIEAINQGLSRKELMTNFPKRKWVMLENGVYDLTGWMHPGTNAIIKECVGREVGRYFYGNHSLETSNIKPHIHSSISLSQIKTFYIGQVTKLESILLSTQNQEVVSDSTAKWTIESIKPASNTVSQISFVNNDFKVKSFGTSLSWLGRHFKVSYARDNSAARLYTIAQSLTETNYALRQNMYAYFDQVMAGNTAAVFNCDQSYAEPQKQLPLFVKHYEQFKTGFSNQVHKTDLKHAANSFRVEGPLGRGLELTATAGSQTIICAGTGLFPLIDFLNMFLWKTMFELIKQKAGVEKAQKINILNIPFEKYMNGLKISFFGAFPTEKEILGLDILKKLAEISKKHNLNNFSAMIKGYTDENIQKIEGRFSQDFFKSHVNSTDEMYYVVGPPQFNSDSIKALHNIGVPKLNIMLV